jgi:ABC-type Fe3+/spermidine/putrescine transport system ATPase subunit
MTGTPVLRMESVRKTFGDAVVLRDVDLEVAPHTVTALIGASGSGKSTLLRCANLLEEIDDGAIWLDDEEITDPRSDRRGLPGVQPLPAHDRAGEHHTRPAPRARCGPRGGRGTRA